MRSDTSHDEVVFALAAACRDGAIRVIHELLAAGVVAIVDGRGQYSGRTAVGALLLDTAARGDAVSVESVNGRAGLVYRTDTRVFGVSTFSIGVGSIDRTWLVLTPEKLHQWTHSIGREEGRS